MGKFAKEIRIADQDILGPGFVLFKQMAQHSHSAGTIAAMSWLTVALGLIREAVGTEAGREVIGNVRSAIRKDAAPEGPKPASRADLESLLAEHRVQVDRSLDAVVRMLNAQNEKLTETIRRQRIWNIALAAGIVVALLIALFR